MKILVTGGLGFVGISIVRFLADALKCEVIASDTARLTTARQEFLQPASELVRYIPLDVRDRDSFRNLVKNETITHIVHAAAITPDLELEHSHAPLVVDVNLGGAINALVIGVEAPQVERVLICSSSGVYGAPSVPSQESLSESGSLQLDNLYAITKYSAEILAERFAYLSGRPIAAVRLGSVYGPCEQPSGSRPHISQVQCLSDALREGRTMRLFGKTNRRDWVYSKDVAEAIRGLLCAPTWTYPVYNIGSGKAILFEEVVASFVKRGLRVEWVEDTSQAEIAMTAASGRSALKIERIQADTGFSPRFSFEAGIADYLDSPVSDK